MSTDNKQFQWTDFRVAEFAGFVKSKNKEGEYDIQIIMDQYKLDHTPKEKFNWVVFTKGGLGFNTWVPMDWRGDKGSNWDESVKTFASLQEADNYVMVNKPCLSYLETMNIVRSVSDIAMGHDNKSYINGKLWELVQSKHQRE